MKVRRKWLGMGLLSSITLLSMNVALAGKGTSAQLEQENLEKVLYCMEILENSPDMAAAKRIAILRDECFSKDYIQHSPHVADGRDAVLALFERRFKNRPNIITSIKRSASQGDLVWLHQHVQNSKDDPGRAVVNIFRMENGKFAEHWNVVQRVPETAKNDNTMF